MKGYPPFNKELEEKVMGVLVKSPKSFQNNFALLNAGLFYTPPCVALYTALCALYANGAPIDLLSVSDQVRKQGDIDQASYFFISSLECRDEGNVEWHIRLLKEWQIRRVAYNSATLILSNSENDRYDPMLLLSDIEGVKNELTDIVITGSQKNIKSFKKVYVDTAIYLNQVANSASGMMGVPTGYYDLDRITMGWQRGSLIVIAGRPSMGKTAFAFNSLYRNAVFHGKKVLFVSMEMGELQLGIREVSMLSGIDSRVLQFPKQLGTEDWEVIQRNERNASENFMIYTPTHFNHVVLIAEIRALVQKHKIEVVAIDYLQLFGLSSKVSVTDAIGEITKALKLLAKDQDIPVLLLSQLNRENEGRKDKEPVLSDLRSSGSIEQDADVVIMIHRPEYYNLEVFIDTQESTTGIAQLLIRKGRQGGTGDVRINWMASNTVFYQKGESAGVYGSGKKGQDNGVIPF